MNPEFDPKKYLVPALIGFVFLVGCVFTFAYGEMGYLLPNINPAYGNDIDRLYRLIMYTVGFVFFGVECMLLYFLWEYRARPGHKATYTHGSMRAEVIWTVIPGLYLLWLALYQLDDWSLIRERFPKESESRVVQVFPEQFAWNFRYAGEDAKFATDDDFSSQTLHVVVNEKVLLKMAAKDVIHSFYLPHARVKQDALPGMLTKVWFQLDRIPCWDLKTQELALLTPAEFKSKRVAAKGYSWKETVLNNTGQREYKYELNPNVKKASVYENGKLKKGVAPNELRAEYVLHRIDIACAELCGYNHFTMRSFVVVHPDAESFAEEFDGMEGEVDEKWTKIWDKVYARFNPTADGQ